MVIKNLTPHVIALCNDAGETICELHPQKDAARVSSVPGAKLPLESNIVAFHAAPTWGSVENLPPPQPGTVFIVSSIVALQCRGRADVFSPGTGPGDNPVRENGRVVGVRRLVQAPQ